MAPFTQGWNEAGSFPHFPGALCGGFELIRENVISRYLQTSSWIINFCCGINYLVSETKWSIFSFKAFTELTFCISERGPPYCSYPSGSLHAGTCALGFGGPPAQPRSSGWAVLSQHPVHCPPCPHLAAPCLQGACLGGASPRSSVTVLSSRNMMGASHESLMHNF